MTENNRCGWCGKDSLYRHYHDVEWGVPVYDDRTLFEFVVLEGAQAGLSWITILKKRENYRKAFAGFDVQKVARFNARSVERLMLDAGIVRNRLKIECTISNARCFIQIQEEYGSFSNYIWGFVDHQPVINRWRSLSELPTSTPLSDRISMDMKKRGFKFFGTTICYSHLQATGVINDHLVECFRYRELGGSL